MFTSEGPVTHVIHIINKDTGEVVAVAYTTVDCARYQLIAAQQGISTTVTVVKIS